MPVVISEFEVVPEAQQSPPPTAPPQSAPQMSPHDVEVILERCHERSRRVRAH
jgi:hypothetical protein